jgi:hypothetical protein
MNWLSNDSTDAYLPLPIESAIAFVMESLSLAQLTRRHRCNQQVLVTVKDTSMIYHPPVSAGLFYTQRRLIVKLRNSCLS